MLLKLLWIIVIAWIVHRVFIAGRNLVRIAMGREDSPLPGAGPDPFRTTDRPARPADAATRPGAGQKPPADVEDARWVDL